MSLLLDHDVPEGFRHRNLHSSPKACKITTICAEEPSILHSYLISNTSRCVCSPLVLRWRYWFAADFSLKNHLSGELDRLITMDCLIYASRSEHIAGKKLKKISNVMGKEKGERRTMFIRSERRKLRQPPVWGASTSTGFEMASLFYLLMKMRWDRWKLMTTASKSINIRLESLRSVRIKNSTRTPLSVPCIESLFNGSRALQVGWRPSSTIICRLSPDPVFEMSWCRRITWSSLRFTPAYSEYMLLVYIAFW